MTPEETMMCGCGRILVPCLNEAGERIGVTHSTAEDEDHHNEYFSGLTAYLLPKNFNQDDN